MDELDRTIHKDETQRHSISSLVAQNISDLAVLTESLRQLNLYQPWASTSEKEGVSMTEEMTANYAETFNAFAKLIDSMKNVSLAEEGNPSQRYFYYPIEKRRTRQTVEDLRKAEQRLDKFWQKVDQRVNSADILREDYQVQRTPEWVSL